MAPPGTRCSGGRRLDPEDCRGSRIGPPRIDSGRGDAGPVGQRDGRRGTHTGKKKGGPERPAQASPRLSWGASTTHVLVGQAPLPAWGMLFSTWSTAKGGELPRRSRTPTPCAPPSSIAAHPASVVFPTLAVFVLDAAPERPWTGDEASGGSGPRAAPGVAVNKLAWRPSVPLTRRKGVW
jgi:hypothetical protein